MFIAWAEASTNLQISTNSPKVKVTYFIPDNNGKIRAEELESEEKSYDLDLAAGPVAVEEI